MEKKDYTPQNKDDGIVSPSGGLEKSLPKEPPKTKGWGHVLNGIYCSSGPGDNIFVYG